MRKFKSGDKVKLKSGGPEMTVKNYDTKDLLLGYHCQWYVKDKLQEGFFPEESLIKVEEEKE